MTVLQRKQLFKIVASTVGLLAAGFAGSHPTTTAAEDRSDADSKRPNILFLLSDDQRPDTIAALGNKTIRTPHVDALVARGTTFLNATCANPICTPSRAEILSGASGFANGVLDFGGRINSNMALWPEAMKQAGYRTAFVGKWHNRGTPAQHGFEDTRGLYTGGGGKWMVQSFDWNGRPVTGYRGWVFKTNKGKPQPERGVGLSSNISEDFADAAIDLVKQKSDQPFFIQVSFTAPHDPLLIPHGYESMYNPAKIPLPENFLPRHSLDHGNFDGRDEKLFEQPRTPKMVRDELAVYYAVISHMDAQIGRILESLEETGQRKNTIVLFASDHGLGGGSHGIRGKQNMYDHTIRVPLIFAGPGIPEGKRTQALCYLRDLFPTTCDMAGVDVPAQVEGKSLLPVITGKVDTVYPHVFGYFRNFQRMIRTDRWKLIEYPQINRRQLFDLEHDPHELKNLAGEERHKEIEHELTHKLRDWQKQKNDPVLTKYEH